MKRTNYLLLSLGLLLLPFMLDAQRAPQKSWKKLKREAAEFEKLGDNSRAALYYESAYTQKSSKPELLYMAGVCYLKVRDYANAVKCLADVKDKNNEKNYDKPGYQYALALKQTGQYQAAKDAFNEFLKVYKGSDQAEMQAKITTEIQGCNFALKAQEYTNPNISLNHLALNINTEKTEFAPIPFSNNVLYFSSSISGVSKIYRSQKTGEDSWSSRQVPTLFAGKMEKPHYGNGSFSADGKRFYFTECDFVKAGELQCMIYIMSQNEDGSWANPQALADYINAPESNTTHPFVITKEDKEILYFASDREGGKGGLDLWYASRDLKDKEAKFSLPKNLGPNINTAGDEITPFYHFPSQTLYFSTNGRISAGGFDIFKSKGEMLKWEVAQNVGFPLNSAADDLYFIINEAHKGGYLVSNRTFDPHKVTTTNDDIFHFGQEGSRFFLSGKIMGEGKEGPLEDVNIKLFEVIDGNEELISDKMLAVGEYKFDLKTKKEYLFEISAEGYPKLLKTLSTEDTQPNEKKQRNFVLPKAKVAAVPEITPEAPQIEARFIVVPEEFSDRDMAYLLPDEVPLNESTGEPYAEDSEVYDLFIKAQEVAKLSMTGEVYWQDEVLVPYMSETTANTEPEETPEEAGIFELYAPTPEAEEGVAYQIQVAAVRKYRAYRFEELQEGPLLDYRLGFEPIDGGITRVMILPLESNADGSEGFKTKSEALNVLSYILDHSRFKTAFVGRYENGERVGEGFRGLDEDAGLIDKN
ncbi:PD40 domain-containing protein [Saprospira grandis]|uniref:Outer membrane peptidoglycan-associated protein n=1 Tax=Saprospira grandis (strain Lewin) TaxID=984262 RepID=H6LAN0_SAPGL|nr:PD40 domain-containing protein [Saprospira grandis]AFC25623.1 outer membrane peptidoglycan-associated protein [Saprospira grandis str. Lewin]